MKQRIGAGQLQELSEEQKERLREWWKPQVGDFLYSDIYKQHGVIYCIDTYNDEARTLYVRWWNGSLSDIDVSSDFTPLLSIGQCIEILRYKTGYIPTLSEGADGRHACCIINDKVFARELIDALWSAVKSVL